MSIPIQALDDRREEWDMRSILEIDPDSVTAMAGLDRCKTKKNDLAGMLKNQLRALFIAWRRLN